MRGLFHRFGEEGEHHHHHQEGKGEAEEAPFLQVMGAGLELIGTVGDTKSFNPVANRQEHYLQPGMNFHVAGKTMVSLGFAFGLTDAGDDRVRRMVGWDF